MLTYIWKSKNWPTFTYDANTVLTPLGQCRKLQGQLLQQLATLDENYSLEAEATLLEAEALRTSEIEGVQLNPQSVRSSVARKLGLDDAGVGHVGQYEENLVDILLNATTHKESPLTTDQLFSWHAALFPTGYSGRHKIQIGEWRSDEEGAMQVISGRPGRQIIHYEAPPAKALEEEIAQFLEWFNSDEASDGIIRAAIAHFWFVTIHPFDDGNGRLARIITDMAMAQDEKTSRRAYSLSAQIAGNRKAYYQILEKTQKGDGDITEWLLWFVDSLKQAILKSKELIKTTLAKADFWKTHSTTPINERQRKVLNRLLDAGFDGFEGGLTNKKYTSITKAAYATATRDLADLVEKKMLVKTAAGRSTKYAIKWGN
ncbi:Fic family protein [Halodesulfovibrio marinisediminis]|uniref:Fic family protein n=1 Tax=Halodesulfovibrio marinisediminis DSM 17456 TaxID=1121457 RepID=A0A1N6FN09_9BACT|nr:Fic family protein [Halodesulfovibrio marinisediminis]SIN96679.1 Fic family protein [Halodesulfovibrio marinisediminis DSM 17456]